MTIEGRNNWLVQNMDIIVSTIQRYCDRDDTLEFDDVYSEIMEWLIKKIDSYDEEELLKVGKKELTQIVGNKINSLKRRVQDKEEAWDPGCFERIYDPDFNENIIPWECEKYVSSLNATERYIFTEYVFGDDVTFKELGKKVGLSVERIRQIYEKARKKVAFNFYYGSSRERLYYKYEGVAKYQTDYKYVFVPVKALIGDCAPTENCSRFALIRKISEELGLSPFTQIDMSSVKLTNIFISSNLKLDYLYIEKHDLNPPVDDDEYVYSNAYACEYVYKIKCFLHDEEFDRTEYFVLSKREQEVIETYSFLTAKSTIMNNCLKKVEEYKERNPQYSDVQLLSPIRSQDIVTRHVHLKRRKGDVSNNS